MKTDEFDTEEFREFMRQTNRCDFDLNLAMAFSAGQSSKTEIVAWLVGIQTQTGEIGHSLVWDRGQKPHSIGFEAIPLRGLSSRIALTVGQ